MKTELDAGTWAGAVLSVSEFLIALAYFVIPLQLYAFLRKRRVPHLFTTIRVWFMLFIIACGVTHLLGLVAQYTQVDVALLLSKVITAVVSLGTVVVLTNHMSELNQLLLDVMHLEEAVEESRKELQALGEKNDRLQELKDRAEALARTRQEFMATISHEVRTPLHAILGYGEILKSSTMDASQKTMVETLHSSAKLLSAIVDDVLDFSKYEKADFRLEEKPFKLVEVMKRSMGMVSGLAKRSNAKLRYRVLSSLPMELVGDQTRLSQLLGNLLSNSIKFSKEGVISITLSRLGSNEECERWRDSFSKKPNTFSPQTSSKMSHLIDIESPKSPKVTVVGIENEASHEEIRLAMDAVPSQAEVKVPLLFKKSEKHSFGTAQVTPSTSTQEVLEENQNWILLSVADTGTGIDPQALPNVFKRFVQSNPSTSRLYGGTGLGLAICLEIVKKMGGSIHVESVLGEGTTMHVLFPEVQDSESSTSEIIEPTKGWINYNLLDQATARGEPTEEACFAFSLSDSATDRVGGRHGNATEATLEVEKPVEEVKDLSRLTVLVADDNEINRVVTSRLLKQMGVGNVLFAEDGVLAVKLCQGIDAISCILMDLNMPNLDGKGATQEIRKIKHRQGLPICAFTAALTSEGEVESLKEASFDGVVSKPCNVKKLRDVLNAVHDYQFSGLSLQDMQARIPYALTKRAR